MNNIEVLVVDDSAFMRKMISDMITQTPGMNVVDTARNGRVALEKIKALNPDVVTLDVEMPELDGLSALKQIMSDHPVPVIMLSSLTSEGTKSTIQSIEFGAVDFLAKPSGSISLDINQVKDELVNKIRVAAQANINPVSIKRDIKTEEHVSFAYDRFIVSIGVSTGGPKALQTLIQGLPNDFPAPILIVQHMPPKFTTSLADRLDRLSPLTVKEATHGEIIRPGVVYIAPGDYHMEVEKIGTSLAVKLHQEEYPSRHRPAANKLFESLANISGYNHISAILTGMGNDGSAGAKQLKDKQASSYFVAESEETAVIYGMPKAMIENVGVNKILPIGDIAMTITHLVNQGGIR